jgi:hypothetical protein
VPRLSTDPHTRLLQRGARGVARIELLREIRERPRLFVVRLLLGYSYG